MTAITIGHYQTQKGSKYLQQLCKHFEHKIEVAFTPEEGTVNLPVGLATLNADADGLTVRIELSDGGELERAHRIIDSHLERFAFREDFTAMDWTTTSGDMK